MTELEKLIVDIGNDLDLLMQSDAWLANEAMLLEERAATIKKEAEIVQKAAKVKRILQQNNLVPVQKLTRADDGSVEDVVVQFEKLKDAVHYVLSETDTLGQANAISQLSVWDRDGYDLSAIQLVEGS